MIRGFDAEFSSLEHYIIQITERIWEGGQTDLIEKHYDRDCVVESPLGLSRGLEAIIDGTKSTLSTFPDRRLLDEAVLVSGSADLGFLSSHRIFSPMTHAGPGRFGVPTNRPVFVRTIADCVCRENRIVHEWLVRDHGAIARQIGLLPSTLAKDWLRLEPGWSTPRPSFAPAPFSPSIHVSGHYLQYLESLPRLFGRIENKTVRDEQLIHGSVISWHPGGFTSVGVSQRQGRVRSLIDGLSFYSIDVESATIHPHPNPQKSTLALRFRLRLVHNRYGHYGEPTGTTINTLVIQHIDFCDGKVIGEWILIDEVSIWMQILSARASHL
jgi:predicted ester cyclase